MYDETLPHSAKTLRLIVQSMRTVMEHLEKEPPGHLNVIESLWVLASFRSELADLERAVQVLEGLEGVMLALKKDSGDGHDPYGDERSSAFGDGFERGMNSAAEMLEGLLLRVTAELSKSRSGFAEKK